MTQFSTRIKRASVTFFQGAGVSALPAALLAVLLAVLLAACAGPGSEEPAAETGDASVALPVEKFTISEDAETDHFVAAVDDNLFVGVAVAQEGAGAGEGRPVAVYLCDNQMVSQWIRGEITGEQGTLVAGESSAEVTIAGDSVSGTVALDGGEPRPFTAEPADDDAGVYRATVIQGGVDHHIDWVVLNDGRQRGPLDGKGNDPLTIP